ncbi:MAG: NADH-quinone oxidoreductase subunit D, partial [Spirochaetia bacterium]|nr:NADH-quinone oxidoreductase subunit D [Spirochaetia bacterium]
PFVHFLRERESVNDLLESICGARLTYNYVWIGGVSHDLPEGFTERALEYLDHFDRVLGELNRLLSKNTIFINRLKGVGIIDRELAVNCGLVGPNLRASGIQSDIRRDEPYSVYNELEFDIPAGQGFAGFKGDSYDRFYCRMLEMEQSSRILRQALKMIPNEGEIRAKLPRVFKPRPGESVARVESSRGSMMYYILSDGTIRPVRVKIRTGSFHAMTVLEKLAPGMMISDFISLFASLDVDAPEIDR